MSQARQIAEHSLAISLGRVRLVTQYRIGLSHSFPRAGGERLFWRVLVSDATDLRTCPIRGAKPRGTELRPRLSVSGLSRPPREQRCSSSDAF
jgi:hypothetical protein